MEPNSGVWRAGTVQSYDLRASFRTTEHFLGDLFGFAGQVVIAQLSGSLDRDVALHGDG